MRLARLAVLEVGAFLLGVGGGQLPAPWNWLFFGIGCVSAAVFAIYSLWWVRQTRNWMESEHSRFKQAMEEQFTPKSRKP